MKYFVCSEEELLRLVNSVWNATVVAECAGEIDSCRAREVYLVSAFDPDTNESATYWEEP